MLPDHRRSSPEPAPDRSIPPETPTFVVETRTGTRWTVGTGTPQFVAHAPDLESWRGLLGSSLQRVAAAFIDGVLDVEGDLVAAVRWWYERRRPEDDMWTFTALAELRLESWFQSFRRAQRNIEFHYDRSNEFYRQFLDEHMQYSSAYFTDPSVSLDEAQAAKLDYILRKLDIEPGNRFLDIGCGWGALVIHAAERCHADAVGCTLSSRQFELATEAVRARGLSDRVSIQLRDYRTLGGRFECVASVGMYEHVGRHRLNRYFETVARMMEPGARLLNSGIARPEGIGDDAATVFLRRAVFPGGEIPYLADVIRAAERAGLEVLDVENLRWHYALTCQRWVERLQQRRDACLAHVDVRTYRTWLLYLAGSVVCFERDESELFHILFLKRSPGMRQHWTRRYMYA